MAQNKVEGSQIVGEAPEVMNPAAPSQPDPSVAASPSCSCGGVVSSNDITLHGYESTVPANGTFYFQATPIQWNQITAPITAGFTVNLPNKTILPDEWFTNPLLASPTPLTITDEGRIFGHLATWKTCHTGYQNQCVRPPISASAYAYFLTGESVLASGAHIPTGVITFNTGHPGLDADARGAIAHYDNTGTVAADVAIGEDEVGIWVAGAMRDTDPAFLRVIRGSALSGDWRPIDGHLELVAALAVNTPGFPIPRTLAASGDVSAMTGINAVDRFTTTLTNLVRSYRGLEASVEVSAEEVIETITEVLTPAEEVMEEVVADVESDIPHSCSSCGQSIPEPVTPIDPTQLLLQVSADTIRRQVLRAV